MAERITSPQNPYLQHVKKLRAVRKYRYANRAFLADGSKLVEEAIRWGLTPEAILTREGVPFPVPEGVRHIIISDRLMKDVSRMDTPQGVMAVCPMPEQRAPELVPGCLILDGIQDPGNLGTILRTADAFDLPVVLSEGCADPYGEKTVRATMGAVFRTQPCQADRRTILDSLRARQIPLCVTALSPRAQDIRALDLKRYAVVIGSEGQGVCADFLQAADQEAIIPMSPRCESLNAAAAATIVLWQLFAKG